MNVVTALNKKYIPYTTVMLLSLGMNSEENVDAYLLNNELSDIDIQEMQDILSAYGVTIHPVSVDRSNFSDLLPRTEQWSIETYYRLLMTDIMPDNIDRFLYLDGDMIINKSLKELYYLPFEGNEIIAAYDKSGLNLPESYGPKNNEMLAEAYQNGYRYFNAGMMLINLAEIRKNYSFQTYVDAFKAWNYQMEAPDQDILNWVHWKKVGYVDCQKYNLFARIAHNAGITYDEVKEAVSIVHFTGYKPWENGNVHFDIEKLWWDYAKKTPFYHELMEAFIESAMEDTTLENYIQELIDKNGAQKELIDQIMAKMKQFL